MNHHSNRQPISAAREDISCLLENPSYSLCVTQLELRDVFSGCLRARDSSGSAQKQVEKEQEGQSITEPMTGGSSSLRQTQYVRLITSSNIPESLAHFNTHPRNKRNVLLMKTGIIGMLHCHYNSIHEFLKWPGRDCGSLRCYLTLLGLTEMVQTPHCVCVCVYVRVSKSCKMSRVFVQRQETRHIGNDGSNDEYQSVRARRRTSAAGHTSSVARRTRRPTRND